MRQDIVFTKMHSLGNDFVVVDARRHTIPKLTARDIQCMANRHRGIGFDQMLIIETAPDQKSDGLIRIFNSDGNEVFQCGNGLRCAGWYVMCRDARCSPHLYFLVGSRPTHILCAAQDAITLDVGIPSFEPSDLPFITDALRTQYTIVCGHLSFVCGVVSIGNPHVVAFCDTMPDERNCVDWGIALNAHPAFPKGINVGWAQCIKPDRIDLRVYERGAGMTQACGSGACAAVAVGVHLGVCSADAKAISVEQLGGRVTVYWTGSRMDSIYLTGSAHEVFTGNWRI